LDEVLEISRLSSKPERSSGMLGVGVELFGLGVIPVWFVGSIMMVTSRIWISAKPENNLNLLKIVYTKPYSQNS